MRKTALITGASSGIGNSLATELAKNGYNLILIAEKAGKLNLQANKIRAEYGINIIEITKDLTHPNAAQEIYDELEGKNVDVLVNNAGVGQKEKFHDSDIEKDLTIIHLNIEALVRLTKLFVKDMINRGDGKILNVGSVAGFQPGPLLAVYHASKAFVVSFSESLAKELEDTGVSVTVLCPGPTDTQFFERADMENARILEDGIVMEPDKIAEIGFDALMNEVRVVIPGMSNKILTFTRRLIPQSMQASLHKKFYEVKEEDTNGR